MNTLYLHIGIFKTGSSALQVFFAQNIERLKQDNIYYPELGLVSRAKQGNITAGNGVWIARSLLPKTNSMAKPELQKQQLQVLATLLRENTGSDVLLSSEFFSDVPPKSIKAIKQAASEEGYTLKIIGYVRDQVSYLESLYIQHVKRRCITDLPETYIRALYPKIAHLKFGSYFEQLAAITGEENLIVKPYGGEDIFADFLSIFGLKTEGYTYPEQRVNLSLPPDYLPIFLELNKLQPRQSFSDQAVQNYAITRVSTTAPKTTCVSAELQAEIKTYFKAENQKLYKQWFDEKVVFASQPLPYVSIEDAAAKVDLSTVTNLLGGIIIQQEKRLNNLENAIRTLNTKFNEISQ